MKNLSVLSVLACAAALSSAACSASTESSTVKPHLQIASQASTGIGPIAQVVGTYSGCAQHTDGAMWVIDAQVPSNTSLSVVKNDTSCQLVLAALEMNGVPNFASPSITLSASWQSSASSFEIEGQRQFYGNAKLSSTDFGGDFTLSLLLSSDPAGGFGPSLDAQYETHSGTVSSESVPAPGYTTDLSGLTLTMDVNHVVQAATGSASLSLVDGNVEGQSWAVVHGDASSASFGDVDAAFGAADSDHQGSTSDPLPASTFDLGGQDLDELPQRSIIIKNTQNGVSSYQIIVVLFGNPT